MSADDGWPWVLWGLRDWVTTACLLWCLHPGIYAELIMGQFLPVLCRQGLPIPNSFPQPELRCRFLRKLGSCSKANILPGNLRQTSCARKAPLSTQRKSKTRTCVTQTFVSLLFHSYLHPLAVRANQLLARAKGTNITLLTHLSDSFAAFIAAFICHRLFFHQNSQQSSTTQIMHLSPTSELHRVGMWHPYIWVLFRHFKNLRSIWKAGDHIWPFVLRLPRSLISVFGTLLQRTSI